MTTLSAHALSALLHDRYPACQVRIFDGVFVLPKRSLLVSAYESFQAWMRTFDQTQWKADKLDCDKWSKLFIAHCILRNALNPNPQAALPVGILCYPIGGDASRAHAINCAAFQNDAGQLELAEIEPQPDGGLRSLTPEERKAAWLAIF